MKTLSRVTISSIYGGLLPARMAKLNPAVLDSFYAIVRDVKAEGGRLIVSDMFRPWTVQAELRKRKPRLAASPGKSFHEAGLAFDFDVSRLGLSLVDFRAIVARHGWTHIKAENWHIQHPFQSLGYRTLQDAIRGVGNFHP